MMTFLRLIFSQEFSPMSACAERVMRLNGCWDKINLIRKRSTAVKVGGPALGGPTLRAVQGHLGAVHGHIVKGSPL